MTEDRIWYYKGDGRENGPYQPKEISSLIKEGVLDESSLVRSNDMSTWKHLDETDLVFLLQKYEEEDSPEKLEFEITHPTKYKFTKPKTVNPRFLESLIVTLILINFTSFLTLLFSFFLGQSDINKLMVFDSRVCLIRLIAAFSVESVLIYNFWKSVQDGYSQITPKKAIILFFIPFYNLSWIIQNPILLNDEQDSYLIRHSVAIEEGRKWRKLLLNFWACFCYFWGYFFIFALLTPIFSPLIPDSWHVTIEMDPSVYFSIEFMGGFFLSLLAQTTLMFQFYKRTMTIIESQKRKQISPE